MWKEAGFRAQPRILYFTSWHSTTWRSDCKLVGKEVELTAVSSQSSVQNLLFCKSTQFQNPDRKLVRKEAGLRAQCGALYSTIQHRTTWWSDGKLVKKEVELTVTVVSKSEFSAEPSIPQVNAVYQMVVRTQIVSLWGKRWGLELRVAPSIPPFNTVPHGSQMESLWGKSGVYSSLQVRVQCRIFYSTSQHSLSNGGQNSDCKFVRKEVGFWDQCGTLYSTSQHRTTWQSDWKLLRKEAEGVEPSAKPSIPPVNTVPQAKLQVLVYDILPSTTTVFSYTVGSRKLSANEQFFFVGAQTIVGLLQTTQIISDIYFVTDHVAYASSNWTKIVWIEMDPFLFTWGGCVSCLCACQGARLLPQSYQYQNLSEGADPIRGQLHGDKECPFSGVTKSGSLEEGAGSLYHMVTWWWSDRKLVRTEAGLRAQCGTQYSTSQHSTTRRSDRKLVRTEMGLTAQHRTLCFTSLRRSDTWWYGGQIVSLWTKSQGLDSKSKLSMELSIPPVNTVPHGWSDGKLLRQVRSSAWKWNSVPPVNMITQSDSGQIVSLWAKRRGSDPE